MVVSLLPWQFEMVVGLLTVIAVTNVLLLVELVTQGRQRERHHQLTKNRNGPVR